jgi:hypothetical protein
MPESPPTLSLDKLSVTGKEKLVGYGHKNNNLQFLEFDTTLDITNGVVGFTGTMTGDLDMGDFDINNVAQIEISAEGSGTAGSLPIYLEADTDRGIHFDDTPLIYSSDQAVVLQGNASDAFAGVGQYLAIIGMFEAIGDAAYLGNSAGNNGLFLNHGTSITFYDTVEFSTAASLAWAFDAALQTDAKTSDQTLTNQTTLQNMFTNGIYLGANEECSGTITVICAASPTPDIKFGWSAYPTGCTIYWGLSSTNPTTFIQTTQQLYVQSGSVRTYTFNFGIRNGANAGTCHFGFAQNTSSGLSTVVYAGSSYEARTRM